MQIRKTANTVKIDEFEKAHQELLIFVNNQIDLMNKNLLFAGQSEPSFYALQKSYCDYESILLGLISIHSDLRIQNDIAKEKYENFYATKYLEVKRTNLALDKDKRFTTQKEIELDTRVKYQDELTTLKAEQLKIENKYEFINRIIESWKNYMFVLTNLSKNSQAEAAASKIAYSHQPEFED